MSTGVSERDMRDKILNSHPIPNNVEGTQKLDKYVKELLSENKKLTTLNKEKTLKGTQGKVAPILDALTKLWSIMKAEREILPEDDDKVFSGHMEFTGLFEQSFLLVKHLIR